MKPPFHSLQAAYQSNKVVLRENLFQELGWDDLIANPAYTNTCAIRVSLALIKNCINVRGRLQIKKGRHKGFYIEPGQAKLAKMLAEPSYFGAPEIFKKNNVQEGIGNRKGVVAFWNIPGYMNGRGGHIDIISSPGRFQVCGSDCFWDASEIWFWEF